jgi:hypothetical protein
MATDRAARPDADPPREGLNVKGRQGSPTVTVAFPFSQVHVEANDGALDAIAELAGLVAEVARAAARPGGAARTAELTDIAARANELQERLRQASGPERSGPS